MSTYEHLVAWPASCRVTGACQGGLGAMMTLWLIGCQPAAPTLMLNLDPAALPQVSLVSVQAIAPTEAQVVLKTTAGLPTGAWQLTMQDIAGPWVDLMPGQDQNLGPFLLLPLQANRLINNHTYQFTLRFRVNNQDSVTALRSYTHHVPDLAWQRLPHAPLVGGDFTAYPVTDDYQDLVLARYAGANQLQVWQYAPTSADWLLAPADPKMTKLLKVQPRRGLVQFTLSYEREAHYFYGLGYSLNEQGAARYYYYRDLWCQIEGKDGLVVPDYAGEAGEVAFFVARPQGFDAEQAYFLTQNGTPAMRSLDANFPQRPRAPLPERPGTLATFTLANVGYVVNQVPGQPIHLWAYDPTTDRWRVRANFPGSPRSRGVGFSLKGQGYFGLGAAESDQAGLRDLWRYDSSTDQWQYATEYPGQGNRYLAVLSAGEGVYLGWGYESQPTTTGVRQVACTDWWRLQIP